MINKIKDLKEAWEQGIINLFPAADKGTPGVFAPSQNGYSNIGLAFTRIDENARKWLGDREENKQFFSHGFFWDKSPFDSFEELTKIHNLNKERNGTIEGWCVLIGRGSKKKFLKNDDGELRLACIDIDGYKPKEDPNNEIRKRSCDEIYKAISENAEFDFFAERSQGGGYHLWYLTKQQVLTNQVHHLKHLMFPEGSEFKGFTLNKETDFIEVFSKGGSQYVSCSPTEKYEFVDDEPIELLKMKPVENINLELKNALEKAGFIYNLDPNNTTTSETNQSYHYEIGDYNLDELQKNILNCYREGTMNSFGYILMDNLRRAKYTKEEVYEIFKNLPIDQDLKKVRADLNQQYSVSYDKIAGLSGLEKAIDDYCNPEALDSTKEFFNNLFQKDIASTTFMPLWEELNTEEMILKENKLFILYDGEYWIRKAAEKKNPDLKCYEILEKIEDYDIDTQAYLVVMQDKMGYHYGWSKDLSFTITPNVYYKFLDESESNRNQYIGQAVYYFNISACKNAVSLFLKDLKTKFEKDAEDNGISSAKEKLAHNARNYDYYKYIEKINGITDDSLNEIHLMNNHYVINDSIIKEMKIIEKKSIAKAAFTPEGEQLKTDIYGQKDVDIIGNFAIIGLNNFQDVIGQNNIKEAELISKEGRRKIKFDKTSNLITGIDNKLGLRSRIDMAKKGILGVIDFILKNKNNHENGFYSSADGIFSYNDEIYWFEDNKVKKVEKPSKDEFNNAIKVLKKLFRHTSIKDKSKIATIFRWFLSAPFAYLIRDGQINGNYIKFMTLIGSSDTGKTALCLIFSCIWTVESRHKGTDAHNATNFAELFKLSGFPLFIDEADSILEDDKKLPIIKSVYDTNYSRSKKEIINGSWEQKRQIALSIAIMTSNTYYESTEKSEVKRVINMAFNPEDASSDKGKNFKKIFNVDADEGYKNSDFKTFEALGREFFHQIKEKYKEKTFEEILDTFLESLGVEEALLEYDDSAALNKNIDDTYRKAIIDLIVEDFNQESRFDGGTIDNIPKENTEEEQLISKRKGKFFKVVDEQRIDYLSLTSDYKFVRVTGGINKQLRKKGWKFDNMNIRTILNLFKEYNTGIDINGNNVQYVNIPIELLGL